MMQALLDLRPALADTVVPTLFLRETNETITWISILGDAVMSRDARAVEMLVKHD